MHYVYILQSQHGEHFYVGLTADPEARLLAHNAGQSPHTAKFRLWSLRTCIAFSDQKRAREFEKYLKTGSGRAFSKKRL